MDAAMDLMWRNSYGTTSVDAICERAGSKKGSFYYFFKSKSELAAAALEADWNKKKSEMDTIFSPTVPPLERLDRYFDFARANPPRRPARMETALPTRSNSAVTAQASDQGAATPDPIAALIPVAAALTNSPSGQGSANVPLAIAAAAIAATSATANAVTGFAPEAKTGEQTGTPKTQGGVPNAKTQAQTPAVQTAATQQTVATDPTVATDVELTSAVGTQGSATGKTTGVKTTTGFQVKSARGRRQCPGQQGRRNHNRHDGPDQRRAAACRETGHAGHASERREGRR